MFVERRDREVERKEKEGQKYASALKFSGHAIQKRRQYVLFCTFDVYVYGENERDRKKECERERKRERRGYWYVSGWWMRADVHEQQRRVGVSREGCCRCCHWTTLIFRAHKGVRFGLYSVTGWTLRPQPNAPTERHSIQARNTSQTKHAHVPRVGTTASSRAICYVMTPITA